MALTCRQVPGRENTQGEDFPQLGILSGIIDGKGCLGGQGSCVIRKKRRIPTDGHPPKKDLMGGVHPEEAQGCCMMGKK